MNDHQEELEFLFCLSVSLSACLTRLAKILTSDCSASKFKSEGSVEGGEIELV